MVTYVLNTINAVLFHQIVTKALQNGIFEL